MSKYNPADKSQKPEGAKPEGAKAGWHLLETTRTSENEITTRRRDRVSIAAREEIVYTYYERSEVVIIVPVTTSGDIVMIRQYRYPVDEWCLEVPAGGTHDTGDLSLEDVVRKELREEVGGTCHRLEHITWFYSSSALSNEKCHVYLALDVELNQQPATEPSESIEIQQVPMVYALELARTGQMKTGPCALAVMLCASALQRYGYETG